MVKVRGLGFRVRGLRIDGKRGGLRTPIERTEQEARIALFFSFFKSTKDKLFQFEVGGLEEHLTVLARILTGRRQTWHDAPAKRSNMSGTMRGVDSQGAWQEGGAANGHFGSANGEVSAGRFLA